MSYAYTPLCCIPFPHFSRTLLSYQACITLRYTSSAMEWIASEDKGRATGVFCLDNGGPQHSYTYSGETYIWRMNFWWRSWLYGCIQSCSQWLNAQVENYWCSLSVHTGSNTISCLSSISLQMTASWAVLSIFMRKWITSRWNWTTLRSGKCGPHEIQQGQVQDPTPGSGKPIPTINIDWAVNM